MFESLGSPIALPWDVSRGRNPMGGKAFFVNDQSGDDDYEGTDPQFPLATITKARDKCTARKHDYIFVQDFYDGTDVFPIVWEKSDCHLIGLGSGVVAPSRVRLDGAGQDVIHLAAAARGIEIAGFQIGSEGSPDGDGISMLANIWGVHIHHCSFGITTRVGIGVHGSHSQKQMEYGLVDNCWFGSVVTVDGVKFLGCTRSSFLHNLFERIPGVGLNLTTGHIGFILENAFFSPVVDAKDAGWAITLGAFSTWGLIAGNKASACGDATGNNPYLDRSSNAVGTLKNGWSDNFDGPALSGGPDTA